MDFLPIWAFWLGFALLLFAAEILTAGFFLFPFGLGAIVAGLADLAGVPLLWQWAVFLLSSGVFLLLARRLALAFERGPAVRAGAERLIGMEGIVIETIDAGQNEGAVRVDNENWRAEPAGADTILKGSRVTVLAIKGARVIVRLKEQGPAA